MLLDEIINLDQQFKAYLLNFTGFYLLLLLFILTVLLVLSWLLKLYVRYSNTFLNLRLFTKGKMNLPKALSYLKVKSIAGSDVIPLESISNTYTDFYLNISGTSVTPIVIIHTGGRRSVYRERFSGNLLITGKFKPYLIENPGIRVGIVIRHLKTLPRVFSGYGRCFGWTINRPVILKTKLTKFPMGMSGFNIVKPRNLKKIFKTLEKQSNRIDTQVLMRRIGDVIGSI